MSNRAIPDPRAIHPKDAVALERQFASFIAQVDDVDEAEELRRRAAALEAYLQGTEGHPYAQGIARRTEARIGQLLGPATQGKRTSPHADKLHAQRASEFRDLAVKVRRGLLKYEMDGEDSPWRSSRRGLLLGVGAFSAEATGQYDWYTPAEYIESGRSVMGGIDRDPASSAEANKVVRARRFFTKENDGLAQSWSGRIWMNPPYSHALIERFCGKLVEEYLDGGVTQAITLTYAATETGWFHALADAAAAIAFPRGRVPYWSMREGGSAPLKGSALFYFGPRGDKFRDVLSDHGITVSL
jgi:hypothetical protein